MSVFVNLHKVISVTINSNFKRCLKRQNECVNRTTLIQIKKDSELKNNNFFFTVVALSKCVIKLNLKIDHLLIILIQIKFWVKNNVIQLTCQFMMKLNAYNDRHTWAFFQVVRTETFKFYGKQMGNTHVWLLISF